jgi:hypothetical protein
VTDLKTAYGTVHAGGACKDNYPSIELEHICARLSAPSEIPAELREGA